MIAVFLILGARNFFPEHVKALKFLRMVANMHVILPVIKFWDPYRTCLLLRDRLSIKFSEILVKYDPLLSF